MKNKIIIVWSLVLFFSITFCLSFIKSNSKDNRKAIKTALLNPKNIDQLDEITITGKEQITLKRTKQDELWIVFNPENPDYYLYADSQTVNNFIHFLSTIINMYKISDNFKAESFGFTSEKAVSLKYSLKDGTYTQLIFGNYDFSENNRYLLTSSSTSVYEISSQIDSFLLTSAQSWSDPLIISKEILGKRSVEDIQKILITTNEGTKQYQPSKDENRNQEFLDYASKLLELRHGGFVSSFQNKKTVCNVRIDFGDYSQLEILIYQTDNSNEFSINVIFNDALKIKTYNSWGRISSWTYNKINTSKL